MGGRYRRLRDVCAALMLCAGISGTPLQAQDWDCTNPYALPQQGINSCLAQEYARADRGLNAAYQEAMAQLGDDTAALLRTAQRLWIPYRDAACDLEADFMRGGTGEPMLRFGCLIRLTVQRTDEIKHLIGIP